METKINEYLNSQQFLDVSMDYFDKDGIVDEADDDVDSWDCSEQYNIERNENYFKTFHELFMLKHKEIYKLWLSKQKQNELENDFDK